jgi:hypothetical protein
MGTARTDFLTAVPGIPDGHRVHLPFKNLENGKNKAEKDLTSRAFIAIISE